jgi:hypothetical protein
MLLTAKLVGLAAKPPTAFSTIQETFAATPVTGKAA